MLPTLREVLALPALKRASPVVRAAPEHLDRTVRWVHVAEVSDIASLLDGGELILTTGIALPETRGELARYVADLDAAGVSALAVELGRRYRAALPAELVAAASEHGLPLIELRTVAPFVAITQAVHTLILDARMREGEERHSHRTLLTALALSDELPPEFASRAAALGVPLERRQLTGVIVRSRASVDRLPALLREVATQAVSALQGLRVPALVGPLDDQRVAVLLAQDRAGQADTALTALAARLHERRRPDALVIGAGSTVTGVERAPLTLREATQVADTAAGLAPQPYFRPPDLRLHGLVYALRDEPLVQQYVERELGELIAHDAAHGTRLYDFLAAYCRTGANKTAASSALFISRAALYDRIGKVQRILGVDLADPEVVLALHFAVLARETSPNLAVRAPTT